MSLVKVVPAAAMVVFLLLDSPGLYGFYWKNVVGNMNSIQVLRVPGFFHMFAGLEGLEKFEQTHAVRTLLDRCWVPRAGVPRARVGGGSPGGVGVVGSPHSNENRQVS